LKREALTLLQRVREYEDLTVMMLLDQAGQHGVTDMIEKGYIAMECSEFADAGSAELLTITDPLLSEAVKKAVIHGVTVDRVDREEAEVADRARKEAQFVADCPEHVASKEKVTEYFECDRDRRLVAQPDSCGVEGGQRGWQFELCPPGRIERDVSS